MKKLKNKGTKIEFWLNSCRAFRYIQTKLMLFLPFLKEIQTRLSENFEDICSLDL